ncbi:FAD-dependent oxidoreductase [Actinoalloteichus hymeniacidonis]|uniref:2-polyprenyl-6-methoxyphenol hydroxylase-like oxidoreductase n=1 Tax=Actinoalloteichus hymeniacidonis TaxID=340345 RepID=A0AAC9HUQ4_9PSEU|nr:FAD-dependent oxidoreductase [Actinoalloteichus hymeniacidonis]AOS65316.1 2-polyprenyl-6-methoxyphenol hydroxylase-like oxidoreductase [Actinoalloteichus hymeniacidonis]MBB5906599.1 2-polyprenyl-6-methoxyphenol hydroxylase-like FAD-dependent oxidoreductase [Actinoalloteichus hymeniacidonis]
MASKSTAPRTETTTCVVVGGGPAGMMLGLLLARAGIAVTVLEKHGDFLRDFRGDTVHPSTLTVLDELGLIDRFKTLPQRRVNTAKVVLDQGVGPIGDLNQIPGKYKYIALVPQWDFLDLLADVAAEEPGFDLRMNTEFVDVLREAGQVHGVRYRDATGEGEIRADLVVACDGRSSSVRKAVGLVPREFGVPIDVLWFRLPRTESDPTGVLGRFSIGEGIAMIDRGDYWQCGYLIPKGSEAELRASDIEDFRSRIGRLIPWLADRADEVSSFDDLATLVVRLNRLRRWHAPGVLCIGDAAHAMSPVGGVGINLAIQDAVATARLLAPALRLRKPTVRDLAKVRRRRVMPARIVQGIQRRIHRNMLPSPSSKARAQRTDGRMPAPFRLMLRFPFLQAIPAYLVGIGPRPEHAPRFARRQPHRGHAGDPAPRPRDAEQDQEPSRTAD